MDDMGRIVLPVELRRRMGLDETTPIEIFAQGERIILEKQRNACIFCGAQKDLSEFKSRLICPVCRAELQK